MALVSMVDAIAALAPLKQLVNEQELPEVLRTLADVLENAAKISAKAGVALTLFEKGLLVSKNTYVEGVKTIRERTHLPLQECKRLADAYLKKS